jgi:hypothetical protein
VPMAPCLRYLSANVEDRYSKEVQGDPQQYGQWCHPRPDVRPRQQRTTNQGNSKRADNQCA